MSRAPLIYTEYADWFHLLTAPADYAEEADAVIELLEPRCSRPPRRVLELGSGGGNLASHLRRRWDMTLTDLSPQMLALSETINHRCEHVAGDMRTLRLGGEPFDAVVVHDAILYMTTEADLRAAFETAYVHLRPGGAAIFLPDCVAETLEPETDCGGHDDPDGRGLRYLEWTFGVGSDGNTFEVVYAYLIRDHDGSTRVVQDHHHLGVFGRDVWVRLLADVGFEVERLSDEWRDDVFVGRR